MPSNGPSPTPQGSPSSSRPPKPPYEHAGFHYEAVEEEGGWETPAVGAGRCRYMVGRKACGKPAAATLWRGRPARPWDYCDDPEHLYGRWIEDGHVLRWRLVKDDPDA